MRKESIFRCVEDPFPTIHIRKKRCSPRAGRFRRHPRIPYSFRTRSLKAFLQRPYSFPLLGRLWISCQYVLRQRI